MGCPTCTRPASSPYRVYDKHGKVLQGCVDDFHTGHLVGVSESNRWHNRPQAKKLRTITKYARKHGYTAAAEKYRANPVARFNRLYREGAKVPKWNGKVSPLMDADVGGRLLRQRLPDWSKTQHVAEARKLMRQRGILQKAWASVRDKEHMRVFKRPADFFDYKISGIGRDEYSEKVKNKLRQLAHLASSMHAAAWAHWRAAGKRSPLK